MKQSFREKNFRPDARALIARCDDIIEEYSDQGLTLTLRQLYYQLVTKNVIANAERSYKNLSSLVSDARLAGLLDWHGIEDRGRQPKEPYFDTSVEDWVDSIKNSAKYFTLPRWRGQEHYVELWVEKDALAGVLSPLADKHHITLMVNKGYSSQSAMYASAQRFEENMRPDEDEDDTQKSGVLLYLGDMDPSGEDMVRDIHDRMEMFGVSIEVRKVALTMAQVRQYNPPPNPAKITDPRASKYIAEHGDSSWEVDALPPNILGKLIDSAVRSLVDPTALARVVAEETKARKKLTKALENVV